MAPICKRHSRPGSGGTTACAKAMVLKTVAPRRAGGAGGLRARNRSSHTGWRRTLVGINGLALMPTESSGRPAFSNRLA